MLLVDTSVRDLLAAFGSSRPTPGGGSASALASAVGASLLLMVAGLPKTRNGSEDDRAALAASAADLGGICQQLTGAIDADTAAYDQVVAAYKLPKGPDEQSARTAAIQRALRSATEVPLGVVRLSARALDHAKTIAAHGHRAAASDVGVAVALLGAGARGGRLNIEINVASIADAGYADAVRTETIRVSDAAVRTADEAEALL